MIKKTYLFMLILFLIASTNIAFANNLSSKSDVSSDAFTVDVINLLVDSQELPEIDLGSNINIKKASNIDIAVNIIENEKFLVHISEEIYTQKNIFKDLYNKGNTITFIGEQLDHKKLTKLMDLPLELEYAADIYALTFKKNIYDGSPIISVVRDENKYAKGNLNNLLALSLAEINEIEEANMEMSIQSSTGVLISTLIDNKTFETYGEARIIQRIYQDPNHHTNFNYYSVINQTRITPGVKISGNNWHNYWLRQEIEYGNPDGGSIEIYDYQPKKGSSANTYLNVVLPLKYGSVSMSIPFTTKGSLVHEAVDRSWQSPRHVFWDTRFSGSDWDSREQYVSEVGSSIINRKDHRLRAISRYSVRFNSGFTYRDGSSVIGVTLWPQY